MPIQSIITSSLEKIFPDKSPLPCSTRFTMLKDDVLSFQLALRPDLPNIVRTDAMITVDSPLAECIRVQRVDLVPSMLPVNDSTDGNILSDQPGLFPDLLTPLSEGKTFLLNRHWTAFWIEIETNASTIAGPSPITFTVDFVSFPDEQVVIQTEVEIVDAVLPKQDLMVTEWFHGDCIADYYQIPVFSETHWEYMRRQIQLGVRRGLTMILTPIFTPALDTVVGGERTTIQLVDVYRQEGVYSFGFEKLERWVRMCQDCGIEYFEMAHLYTQWGAKHCPKIMGYEDGSFKKLFGWEQDALGEDYRGFLSAFLPQLTKELERLGIEKKTVFHISDEPSENSLEQYNAVRAQVQEYLVDYPIMDAMSEYRFFTDGVCENPIIATDALTPFLEGQCPEDLWVYYCCGQGYLTSNRFFGMPSARNRIIGTQFYKYNVKGFLQWGFKFYNSCLSLRHINPFQVTDGEMAFPSGDPFVVYPGDGGEPLESIRMMVFHEALTDLRALKLLEQLTSREHVMALLEDGVAAPITFTQYPQDASYLLTLRLRVNQEIQAHM